MNKIILLFILIPLQVLADSKTYDDVIVDEVTSIYDADTFRATILGWPPIIGKRVSIRVSGVDAPEIRSKCQREKEMAREAKQYVVSLLRNAKVIELRNIQRGKYFRILADVYIDDFSLSNKIIQSGYGRAYDGVVRSGWCD